MFAMRRYGDQQQYFIVIRYCLFPLGCSKGERVVCVSSLEEKIKLQLFFRNFKKSTQFAWERVLTV